MRAHRRARGALLTALIVAAGCATNPAPGPSEPAAPGGPADLDLAALYWFRFTTIHRPIGADGPVRLASAADELALTGGEPAGFLLWGGTLDGEQTVTKKVEIPDPGPRGAFPIQEPFASGPSGESVVYGWYDGERSEVRAASLRTGDDRLLFRDDQVVLHAVRDPASGAVYFARLDAETEEGLGVWRLGPLETDRPEQVLPAAGKANQGSTLYQQLYLSPDGAHLVSRVCDPLCDLRILEIASGRVLDVDDPSGDFAGITDRVFMIRTDCECPFTAVDLDTGASARFGGAGYGTGWTFESERGDVLVYASQAPWQGDDVFQLTAVELETGRSWAVFQTASYQTAGLEIVQLYGGTGVSVPTGWYLLGPFGQLSRSPPGALPGPGLPPRLVRFSDGAIVELPDLDPVPPS